MAFNKNNFGSFGNLPCDMNGYVPEIDDGPWDFVIDHGTERTHDENNEITEYGKWWEEEGFTEWRNRAVEETELASKLLNKWQNE